jgi:hypothetical protein
MELYASAKTAITLDRRCFKSVVIGKKVQGTYISLEEDDFHMWI